MKKILFILICLFIFGCNSKSQNDHVIKKSSDTEDVFHLKSTKIQDFIKLEKELGSKSVDLDGNYITPSKYNLAQPVIFQRTKGDFHPFLRIKYHFSLPDSIVRLIDYDWDVLNYIDISNYNNIKNSKGEPEKRINDYNKKYENLRNELTRKIGKSKQPQSGLKFTKAGEEKYWNRDENWETKDYTISLNLIFTPDSSPLGTYRIRARVDWNSSPNLSKPDNKEQSKIAKDFITSIMNENYDKAWSFVDDEIKKSAKVTRLIETSKPLQNKIKEFGREVEPYWCGVRTIQTGQILVFHSFKFKSDLTQPVPAVLMDVIFLDANSLGIVAFQPTIQDGSKIPNGKITTSQGKEETIEGEQIWNIGKQTYQINEIALIYFSEDECMLAIKAIFNGITYETSMEEGKKMALPLVKYAYKNGYFEKAQMLARKNKQKLAETIGVALIQRGTMGGLRVQFSPEEYK